MKQDIKKLVTSLPKIDLHRHLDGSVRIETIRDAAISHGFPLPTKNLKKLKKYTCVSRKCRSLSMFLEVFNFFYEFLKFPDVVERIAYENCEDAKKENLKYVELRFAPPLQATKNFPISDVVKCVLRGVKQGSKDFGIKVGVIFCIYRSVSEEENWVTVKLAEKYFGDGVVGIDLAGDESKYPTYKFKKFFDYARSVGIPITCHAGEASGPESIADAIKLGAKRIGHGTMLYKDEELMKKVRDKEIPLEICLTSNLQTRVVDKITLHPIKKYYDYGIKITINTDDPFVSQININSEYLLAQKTFNFSLEDIKQIILNSVEASFLPKKEKQILKKEIVKEFKF